MSFLATSAQLAESPRSSKVSSDRFQRLLKIIRDFANPQIGEPTADFGKRCNLGYLPDYVISETLLVPLLTTLLYKYSRGPSTLIRLAVFEPSAYPGTSYEGTKKLDFWCSVIFVVTEIEQKAEPVEYELEINLTRGTMREKSNFKNDFHFISDPELDKFWQHIPPHETYLSWQESHALSLKVGSPGFFSEGGRYAGGVFEFNLSPDGATSPKAPRPPLSPEGEDDAANSKWGTIRPATSRAASTSV